MTLPEFKQIVLPLLNDERYKAQRAVDESYLLKNTIGGHTVAYKDNLEKLEKMQNALRFLENLKE